MAKPREIESLLSQERITVKQINQTALATFLSRQTGKDFPPHGYPSIFTSLREMAFSQQERLLVSFFTNGVEGFPNGRELGKMLAGINNIPWFRPRQEPEPAILEQLTRAYLERLNYHFRPLPLKIVRENWAAVGIEMRNWNVIRNTALDAAVVAEYTALEVSWGAGWVANRGVALDEAETIARGITWDVDIAWDEFQGHDWPDKRFHEAARYAAKTAAGGTEWGARSDARWIVVGDLMPARDYSKGNPFEPLMEMYRLGCWPIGPFTTKKRKTEFVVFIPPIVSPENV